MMRRLRLAAGALLYDWPGFELRLRGWGRARAHPHPWVLIRNRNETITPHDIGVRCEWQFTSELHIANVYPGAATRLMRRALADWPIRLADAPLPASQIDVTFVIGHRGMNRLPHLLATLRSIAAQQGAGVECIVIEQSATREIEGRLPPWVRYAHTPVPDAAYDYNRAWTLNAGARLARGGVLVLHDNDMLVPERYASEAARRVAQGWDFADLKRFTFYWPEEKTQRVFAGAPLEPSPATVIQNLQGASIVASKQAYFEIGGFDESFVGWGGEDNEFWERAQLHGRVWSWGYLPFLHLFHGPQKEKLRGSEAAGIRRWREVAALPVEERIRRLRARDSGRLDRPAVE